MIYFTSDYHFFHDKDFVYSARGFSSIEEMNQAIIESHNKVVKPEDTVYILGDICLNVQGRYDELRELIEALNGELHIICGNHDTSTKRIFYKTCKNVVEVCDAKPLKYRKYRFFLCHYPVLTSNYDDGERLKQKTISLAGHTHTKHRFSDMNKGIIYNVGVDAHNMIPVSADFIIEDIRSFLMKSE